MNATLPLGTEAERLEILHGLNILDTKPDPTLDGLVRTAARIAGTPVALISLLDGTRQWFKASVGIELKETPRDLAFCSHTIAQNHTFVVEDATLDPRFADNPLVTGMPHMRFYAGVPLKVDQQAIGSLCVIDQLPRTLDSDVEAMLFDLARAVEHWMVSWRDHELLRRREAEFEQLVNRLPAVIYRAAVEPPNAMFYVSPRVTYLGGTTEQWLLDPQAKMKAIHPDDRERVMLETAAGLAFGGHLYLDYRMRDAEGRWRHYHDVAHVVQPGEDHAPYLQGIILDITERVAAESTTDKALAYWRGLFTQLPDGVLVVDGAHRILEANPQAAAMLGYSTEELRALNLLDLIDGAPADALQEEVSRVFAGDTTNAERVYRHRDGRRIIVEARASSPVDERYVKVLRDITGRRAQEAQLRKLSEAVEQSSESIYVSDLDGTIEYVNAAGIAASGYSREELIGSNSRRLQSGATPSEVYEEMWASLTAGKPWKGLLYNRSKRGDEYIERAMITPILDHDGRIANYLAVKENVTEKEQMRQELDAHRNHLEELVDQRTRDLQQAKRAAEAANEAKSTFLASMSHEIRTPMNGVVGLVDVLRQSSLSPYQCDLADTIRESSFALLRIIDDILDFSKIEAGRLELEPEVVDLCHLIEQVCVGLDPLATSHGVKLQLFVDPSLPTSVTIDGVRLRQILNNLVGNAIKFSARLEREGHVGVVATIGPGSTLCIKVIDNGIGILPEARDRIFHPFVQGESSTTRRYGGTGLGLTICHRLVEMFHGNIAFESEPGAGSTFAVTLPLAINSVAPQDRGHNLSGIDCYVTVRDAQLTTDWRIYLLAAHARVCDSQDTPLAEWLSKPLEGRLRVLITDAPDDDAHPALLGHGAPQDYGVVRVTEGKRRTPRIRRPAEVDLDYPVLLKDALLQAVQIAAGRAIPAVEQSASALPTSTKASLSIEEAAAQGRLILIAEDNDINQKVILHQLALLGYSAEVVNDGAKALKCWRSGRYALLLTDLHMPGLDGYELTRSIRSEEASGQHIPIIAISATTLRGEAERCLKSGLDDYLSKPVQLDQLAKVMGRWCKGAASSSAPAGVTLASTSGPSTSDVEARAFFDPAVLPGLVGEDVGMLAEFCLDYLRSATKVTGDMRAAVAAGNWRLAGDLAHRLKSSSRAIGVLGVGDCCERIETASRLPLPDRIRELMAKLDLAIGKAHEALSSRCEPVLKSAAVSEQEQAWVVVVDDEPFQSKVLKRQLNLLGVSSVQVCDSGAALLEWLQGRDASRYLLLLDLNMPEMDGVELMRHLAERHFSGSMALVSGANERVLETAAKLAEAYELRVVAHLHKPVLPEALSVAIARWRKGEASGSVPRLRKPRGESEVRHAIESDQLVLHYQPMVAISDGRLVGVEALVRWQHPTDGLLGADAIVEIAENHGMIDALTHLVLQKALVQLKAWRDAGLILRVAINVSMQNLARLNFPEYVLGEVLRYGLTPPDVRLEVTESQLLRDVRVPMDILTRLRLKRIGLSIDDFGTGHSSLSQLCNLPFDELKIDRGFVRGSHDHATQRAIFNASLNMAHQLNMTAVAEGVEDQADWNFVRQAGCDIAQGYFIARPMPAEQIPAWNQAWMQRFGDLS